MFLLCMRTIYLEGFIKRNVNRKISELEEKRIELEGAIFSMKLDLAQIQFKKFEERYKELLDDDYIKEKVGD